MRRTSIFLLIFLLLLNGFTVSDSLRVSGEIPDTLRLVPCGNAIGIQIRIDGVVVVGESAVKAADGTMQTPAEDAGIREGDIISMLNGQPITSADSLSALVEQSGGNPMTARFQRKDRVYETEILPCFSPEEGAYRLGIWVKEDTGGIGTVTYYNPDTGAYGALGHPITESSTDTVLTVAEGSVLRASVTGVKKGAKGDPGELHGSFGSDDRIGSITANNDYGIFGTLDAPPEGREALPIALMEQVQLGRATILANVDGKETAEYEIEIQRVMPLVRSSNKAMVIKITDSRLLAKTGGIVQGMSGSPIIQNGKLVGAVTHVFVNDPTRGYGILIENMLAEAEKME